MNRGTLFAVPFDVDRLEVTRDACPVLDQVGYNSAYRFGTARFLPNRNFGLPQRRSGTADSSRLRGWTARGKRSRC